MPGIADALGGDFIFEFILVNVSSGPNVNVRRLTSVERDFGKSCKLPVLTSQAGACITAIPSDAHNRRHMSNM